MLRFPLSRRPHGFNLELEILATLPLGCPVAIHTLATDFSQPIRFVRRALTNLRKHGYPANEIDNCAVLGHNGRDKAVADCLAYWERVWE